MDDEISKPIEIVKPKYIQETVSLPLENNEFIHILGDRNKFTQAFTEYASQFGVDKNEAKLFFENKVDIQFGETGDLPIPGVNKFDKVLGNVLGKLKGGKALGLVVPNDDKFTLCLDVQGIAKSLPDMKTGDISFGDYQNMTLEQRISGFEQAMKSFTEHEFFHLLQFMKTPQELIKASKQVVQSMRLLFAYTTTSLSAVALFPHSGEAAAMAAIPFIAGAVVYLNKGQARIENDAYSAQKKALSLNLRNPYEFTHETG